VMNRKLGKEKSNLLEMFNFPLRMLFMILIKPFPNGLKKEMCRVLRISSIVNKTIDLCILCRGSR